MTTIDPRDLRGLYGGPERRSSPGRRADDDPTGEVSAMLFGRIALAHREAEEAYFRALDRIGLLSSSGLVEGVDERDRLERVASAANGKAEGLAEAVALLSGLDVVEVRAKAAEESEARKKAGLDGVALARRALEATGRR
jgi:hypothetical protein